MPGQAVSVGTLYASLKLDKSQFEGAIKSSGGLFNGLVRIVKAAALAVAAALAGAGIAAVKLAADFQKSMANVQTLIGSGSESDRRIRELGADVKAMSVETGKSLDDLSGGLYQVISAFGDTADSAEILRTAAKASTAGLATTTDAVNLLSAVTKGYGDTSAAAVQKASDLAFITVKLGQTTFPELAASMGKLIPLGASLKVTQEEIFGAMATLTGVTGGTAEVVTQLQGVLGGIIKQNPAMTAALDKMGFKSGKAALEALGLQGTLDGLRDAVDGDEKAMLRMLGRKEGLIAMLALTGTQAEDFTRKTAAMGDALGATNEAFQIQQATVSATAERVGRALEVILVSFGERFLPVVEAALNWIVAHMPQIQSAFDSVADTIAGLAGAVARWVDQNRPLIGQLQALAGQVVARAAELFGKIAQNVGLAIEAVGPFLDDVRDFAATAGKAFVKGLEAIVRVFTDFGPLPAIIAAVTIAALALNAAVRANPIVAIAGGIIIAIGLLVDAWEHGFWGMRDDIEGFAKAIGPIVAEIVKVVSAIVDVAVKGIQAYTTLLGLVEKSERGNTKGGSKSGVTTKTGTTSTSTLAGGTSSNSAPRPGTGLTHLASGTIDWPGGPALMGEFGPEIAYLPRGATVIPAAETAALRGSPIMFGDIIIQGVGSDVSPGAARRFGQGVVDAIAEGFQQQSARRGLRPVVG